ncbi:hypothetical protein H072_2467 [Dactylellina haptotyla CBS 200.50]|uniref:RRM domain-containing protein n=1 Tax=Dactylellina haptotyla (strain CBS 200.50) TaxID=1284197 RepID=S8AKU2_DACHA|nr:hypothetical protein H072_2467 [Dactylellina haptotyla CBS 200.50]
MSAENATVHVKNISHKTTEKEIQDFFSFCGKIKDFSVTPASGDPDATLSATITFEQPSAARTALLLDNTQLSGSPINVSASATLDDLEHEAHAHDDLTGEPPQEDKPRTAIIAEYLAHGYHMGDKVLQRAIEFDKQKGIYSRFQKFLTELDNKHKVTDKSRAMDSTYGVSDKATQGYNTVTRYLDQALSTAPGQRIHKFYQVGEKQVLDIHNEAMRLKKMKADEERKCTCDTAGPNGECNCAPGSCACSGCKKVTAEKAAAASSSSSSAAPPLYEAIPSASAPAPTGEKATYQ